jgi:hypothetical protein
MSTLVHVRPYQRRKPERPPQYSILHNRLYEETMFLLEAERRLVEELAVQMEAELERIV